MAELLTRWERAMVGRVAPFLDLSESDVDLIAFATEGNTYGIVGTFLPQLQQRRVLVISGDRAYLASLNIWSKLRHVVWRGDRSEIHLVERRRRASIVDVGGYEITLPSPSHRRLEAVLGSNSASCAPKP